MHDEVETGPRCTGRQARQEAAGRQGVAAWASSHGAGARTRSIRELIEEASVDLFDDEVYVFTPKGEVKMLPVARRYRLRDRCR